MNENRTGNSVKAVERMTEIFWFDDLYVNVV